MALVNSSNKRKSDTKSRCYIVGCEKNCLTLVLSWLTVEECFKVSVLCRSLYVDIQTCNDVKMRAVWSAKSDMSQCPGFYIRKTSMCFSLPNNYLNSGFQIEQQAIYTIYSAYTWFHNIEKKYFFCAADLAVIVTRDAVFMRRIFRLISHLNIRDALLKLGGWCLLICTLRFEKSVYTNLLTRCECQISTEELPVFNEIQKFANQRVFNDANKFHRDIGRFETIIKFFHIANCFRETDVGFFELVVDLCMHAYKRCTAYRKMHDLIVLSSMQAANLRINGKPFFLTKIALKSPVSEKVLDHLVQEQQDYFNFMNINI